MKDVQDMLLLVLDKEYRDLKARAVENGLYTDELPVTYRKAKNGSSKDQYAIGMLYRRLGDSENAFRWLMKSASKENADAEDEVARIIMENGSVSVEDAEGYTEYYENPEPWLERAWLHGNAGGAYLMAQHILKLNPEDTERAVHWMSCSYQLGGECDHLMVASHLISKGDTEGALTHIIADAEKGNPSSAITGAAMLLDREEPTTEQASTALTLLERASADEGLEPTCKLYTLAGKANEILGNYEAAFENYEKAYCFAEIEQDGASAQLLAEKLGDMTYCGRGTTQNYTKAVEYFDKVTSFTDEQAKLHYADCKLRGLGTDQSVEDAACLGSAEALYRIAKDNPENKEYLVMAADKGHKSACYEVGKLFFEDEDFGKAVAYLLPVSKDYPDVPYMLGVCLARTGDLKGALAWFELCAESGDGEGMYLAGKFYLEGMGCEKDAKKAVEFFKRSAATGNINGAYELGMCCKNGTGTAKNPDRASMLISAAADNGSAGAMFEMGNIKRLEDKELALDYYRRSAELGYEPAMYQMGFLYEVGYVTGERDVKSALYWYSKCRKSYRDVKEKISACSIELAEQG